MAVSEHLFFDNKETKNKEMVMTAPGTVCRRV